MLSRPRPQPKSASTRLTRALARRAVREARLRRFTMLVWARDRGRCRVCHRVVRRTTGLHPLRGEVHHLLTRGAHPELRYDVANGVLVCLSCHLKLQRHEIALPQ